MESITSEKFSSAVVSSFYDSKTRMNWRAIRKRGNFFCSFFYKSKSRKRHKTLSASTSAAKKGLHVVVRRKTQAYTHTHTKHRFFFAGKFCVNIHDERLGVPHESWENFFYFPCSGKWSSCVTSTHVFITAAGYVRMDVRVFVIYSHTQKRAALFHLPHPPAHNIYERKRRRKKEVECDFHIWKLSPTNTIWRKSERERHTNP